MIEGCLCLCQIPPPLNFLSLIVTIKTSCKTEDANFFPSNFHSISIEANTIKVLISLPHKGLIFRVFVGNPFLLSLLTVFT